MKDTGTENNLILCIARRDVDADRLRTLASARIDWEYVGITAYAHGLLPLLHKHLATVASDLVPPHIFSRLKRESVSNSQNVLHLIGKQLRVYKLFQENGIKAALFKGPLLAEMAYGEIALRQSGDIDLLIARGDFPQARVLLESLGYEMTPRLTPAQLTSHLNNHCEIQFMRDEWFTVIDLHWDLAPRSFVFGVKAGEVMSRLQSVSLAGTTIETFSAEDLVLYQAMHGAKHLWRRLEWISALAESLRATPALSWETIVQRADNAHATRILALGMRLVEEFSDVNIPSGVLASVDSDKAMQRMATQIRDQLFTTFGAADSTETNLYNLRIMDRKRDALISALRSIFVPTLPDWEALALPRSMHPLYYAYRPLRLSKIYSNSIWRRLRHASGARDA
ncbi:MAG TPA: nucleotidyltransferase family protein [Pyrinomonadaceae bacterium]|nr:nucleotidyltransferase family protein [Pyrinomonadaceae bacterium]